MQTFIGELDQLVDLAKREKGVELFGSNSAEELGTFVASAATEMVVPFADERIMQPLEGSQRLWRLETRSLSGESTSVRSEINALMSGAVVLSPFFQTVHGVKQFAMDGRTGRPLLFPAVVSPLGAQGRLGLGSPIKLQVYMKPWTGELTDDAYLELSMAAQTELPAALTCGSGTPLASTRIEHMIPKMQGFIAPTSGLTTESGHGIRQSSSLVSAATDTRQGGFLPTRVLPLLIDGNAPAEYDLYWDQETLNVGQAGRLEPRRADHPQAVLGMQALGYQEVKRAGAKEALVRYIANGA